MKTKQELHREPTVENKYNLTVKDVRNLEIADRSQIKDPMWWRNDVISAWCISKNIGTKDDIRFGTDNSFWIGVYDEDAKAYAGKFRITFSTYGGMCGYNFDKFYDPEEIDNELDLQTHEQFLACINTLIDNGVLRIRKK